MLGSIRIWYPVNRLLRQTLATQAASVLQLCLRLPFLLLLLLRRRRRRRCRRRRLPPLFCFSLRLPPRVHIKLPWSHLSVAGRLAAGK